MLSDRDRTVATEAAPSSFVRRHAYALFSGLVVVAMAGHTANQKWASPDFWVHLAAVREFSGSLLHPGNPLIVGSARDPYMSPYALVLGAIVRTTRADAVTVLALAGLANLVLLLFAIRRFVRCVSTVEFADLFALLFTLTAWGIHPWRWSGFFDVNSLGTVLPLSSTFASAIGLITVASLCLWLRGGGRYQLVLVGIGTPVVLLSHPMTGVWVGAVGIALVFTEMAASNVRRLLSLLAVVAGSSVLALAWPFYSILQAAVRSTIVDMANAAMYHNVLSRTFLALPGFVLLGIRLTRRHRDPLALGAIFSATVYGAGYVFHHEALGRVLPGIMLMAHVAMAIWVAERVAGWKTAPVAQRYWLTIGVAGAVLVGAAGSAAGMIRAVPRALLPSRYEHDQRLAGLVAPFHPLSRFIARDDVVVASHRLALGVAGSSGKVIAPPALAPFVHDIATKERVLDALLSPDTSAGDFRNLIDRYHVKWFVLTPDDARNLQVRVRDGELRPETSTPTLQVFRVARTRTS